MGICPKNGNECTFDRRFDTLIKHEPEKSQTVHAIRRAVFIASSRGNCPDGIFVEDANHYEAEHCGNSRLDEMSRVAMLAAETLGEDPEVYRNMGTLLLSR